MRFVTVFIVLAALSGQLDASPPLAPPTDGGLPALQPDGSYQQTIKLQGDQQQGWASLRRAFHSRTVAVTCPGSPASAFWVCKSRQNTAHQLTPPGWERWLPLAAAHCPAPFA